MRREPNRYFLWAPLLFVVILFLSGCASTKPNKTYAGPYPKGIHRLADQNPLLANELGKIPEIQDGISKREADTLSLMVDIYTKEKEKFDSMFNQMYLIGKPEVRKYNSPLQAFFWLLEDNSVEKAHIVLNNYQLMDLLDYSWVLGNTEHIFFWKWKMSEARLLYQSCSDPSLKDKIDKFEEKNKGATGYIINLAKEYPEVFEYKYDETTYDEFRSKTKKRWGHFNTVVERLNSPELIDYYEGKNFVYRGYLNDYSRPSYIFKKQRGNCRDHASFAVHCLRKAGYKAWTEIVANQGHITTFYKTKEGYFVLDRAYRRQIAGKSRIRGPYNSTSEIKNKYFIAGGQLIFIEKQ